MKSGSDKGRKESLSQSPQRRRSRGGSDNERRLSPVNLLVRVIDGLQALILVRFFPGGGVVVH